MSVDRIVVDTDSQEYANLALSEGAEVPFLRDPRFAGNSIGIKEVVRNAVGLLGLNETDSVCCVFATNPLLQSELVDLAHDIFTHAKFSGYVTPVVKYGFPPQRGIQINSNGEASMRYPEFMYHQSQNLEPWFHETAQFWWGRAETWLSGLGMQELILPIVVKEWMQQDIDNLDDLLSADAKYDFLKINPEIIRNEITILKKKYLS